MEHIESGNTRRRNSRRTVLSWLDNAHSPVDDRKETPTVLSDIYRYLISKDQTLLTTEGALSVFKLDDANLSEEIIRILQTNESPVLFELYRSIMGTEATHSTFFPGARSYEFMKTGRSYITGKTLSIESHYQEWYDLATWIIKLKA